MAMPTKQALNTKNTLTANKTSHVNSKPNIVFDSTSEMVEMKLLKLVDFFLHSSELLALFNHVEPLVLSSIAKDNQTLILI